ncbi:class I SAM-dependent methyltransferase [Synoicihabitans lomoniglobus]|uniref:Class I SAM-dependent methyltransferase n=1 Tax=Synoicihabitans lomoniglobus TaxID=2909285 RepID=A0AAF0CMQ6_9BACT|nr:class I SAM-dependent methyltransferase [Opitutaceae bacterium LMO-M01]WED63380.1 class I SAM-dependent methyltransferase [Opitutaceae bacterium LMO-M01]
MSFDTLAPHYRWLEKAMAGRVLQRARLAHLAVLDRAERILLVGEGPGRFLGALRARRPDVAVTVVDSSAGMLQRARRVDRGGPTEFVQADLRAWTPEPGAWDAIATHCVLDCFGPDSLAHVVATLARAAATEADWIVTDFAVPLQPGWRRLRARGAHALMYGSFRLVTGLEARQLTPPDDLLQSNGFGLQARRTFNHGLLQADHWHRQVI